MSFKLDKLYEYCRKAILEFSTDHKEEVFYGFSIDSNLLCLNSEEKFQETLKNMKYQWGGYEKEGEVRELRENTGDWAYQGFAEMSNDHGFNMQAYSAHYDMSASDQKTSDYGVAMDSLIEKLINSDSFDCLNTTEDFYINRVEHNY